MVHATARQVYIRCLGSPSEHATKVVISGRLSNQRKIRLVGSFTDRWGLGQMGSANLELFKQETLQKYPSSANPSVPFSLSMDTLQNGIIFQ